MPIENVRSSEPSTFTAYAATSVESRPPLRKAPTGTSLSEVEGDGLAQQLVDLFEDLGLGAVILGPKLRSQ